MDNESARLIRKVAAILSAIQQELHAAIVQNSAHREQQQPPSVLNIRSDVSLPPSVENYYASEQSERPTKNTRDRSRLALEGLTLVAAIIAAVFTGLTLSEFRKQTPKIAEQAKAASDAITYNRKAFVISERASVFIPTEFLIQQAVNKGGEKAWFFMLWLENGRNTPALDVSISDNDNAPEFANLPRNFDFAPNLKMRGPIFATMGKTKASLIIGPHAKEGGGGLAVTDSTVQKVNIGQSYIYFWGEVTYRDVFSCFHKTEFCRQVLSISPDSSKVAVAWRPQHNCSDQDCKDYKPTTTEICTTELQ